MMRATRLPVKDIFKQVYPMRATWRCMTISIPNRHEKDGLQNAGLKNDDIEPVVAFSRPPPLPPVLGPLVLFSLLEMGSNSDGNDS